MTRDTSKILLSVIARIATKLGIDIPEDLYFPKAYHFRHTEAFRDAMIDLLVGPRTLDRGLYNEEGIRRLIHEHDSHAGDHAFAFMRLAWLELFLRVFSDGDGFLLPESSRDLGC